MSSTAETTSPGIARAIQAAEDQIAFLRQVDSMKAGDQYLIAVAALRPVTHLLGLEPQPQALRGELLLVLTRTTEGWRVG